MHTASVWTLALILTAIAAATDLRSGKIPNWLNGTALLLSFAIHLFKGAPGLLLAVSGLLCSALVPALFFFATQGRALGGGDVKVFAAVGATLGPMAGLEVQLLSYCVLLFFALCTLSYQGKLRRTVRNALGLMLHRCSQKRVAPAAPELLTSMRLGPSIWIACVAVAAYRNLPWLQLWI